MDKLFSILASVIPSILFLVLVVYFVIIKRKSTPRIYKTHMPLKLVGISIKSCDADIERDDAIIRAEFERIRIKDGLEKPYNLLVVRFHEKEGEDKYEYFVGMPGDPNKVPEGYNYIEIPVQTYVMSNQTIKKGTSILKSITRVKFFIYKKWLPKSKYELNRDQAIKAIEVHNLDENSNELHPQLFVAVKEAKH